MSPPILYEVSRFWHGRCFSENTKHICAGYDLITIRAIAKMSHEERDGQCGVLIRQTGVSSEGSFIFSEKTGQKILTGGKTLGMSSVLEYIPSFHREKSPRCDEACPTCNMKKGDKYEHTQSRNN